MLNSRTKWILILSVMFAAMLACSKKEEAPPAQPETKSLQQEAKSAPQAGVEHAKEQAHQEMEEAHEGMHEAMKEGHQAMEAMHAEMKEGHQAMTGAHEQAMAAADMALGEKIYNENCVACHGQGIAGAPKVGDKAAWEEHIAGGMDHLVQTALKGEGAMPPKGGNPALSDEEVRAAVAYMVEQSR